MTSLGDHPVWHPVADLFKEDLMVTCSDAGDGLARITPPIIWAKAVPALPTISATSTTVIAIIIAILVRTSCSFPLEKGPASALSPSRCHRRAHINSSICGATHPPSTLIHLPLFTVVPGETVRQGVRATLEAWIWTVYGGQNGP